MFPEWALLYIVDEANGREVHVVLAMSFDFRRLGHVCRRRRTGNRAFDGSLVCIGYGRRILSGSKYVRNEGVIVETPYSVRTGWLESVCLDYFSYELEIPS